MNKKYEVKLAEVLKREMKETGWTIEALSQESGVSPSTLREWRNGRVPRNPIQVKLIADVLKVSFFEMYFGRTDAN